MKRFIKVVFILGIIFYLCHLFIMPLKNPIYLADTIAKAKKYGSFMSKYEIIKIDTLEAGYDFPIDQIWTQKSLYLERNKYGIIRTAVCYPDMIDISFSLLENSTIQTDSIFEGNWSIWSVDKEEKMGMGKGHMDYLYSDFLYSPQDTIDYFFSRRIDKKVSEWDKNNYTPVFRFKIAAVK